MVLPEYQSAKPVQVTLMTHRCLVAAQSNGQGWDKGWAEEAVAQDIAEGGGGLTAPKL